MKKIILFNALVIISAMFNQIISQTDLQIVGPGTDNWLNIDEVPGGLVSGIPIVVMNAGTITITNGSTVGVAFEYPVGTVVTSEIFTFPGDLHPTEVGAFELSGSVNMGVGPGPRYFRAFITYPGDVNASNDTISGWLVLLDIDIAFERAVTDTIKTINYPYTMTSNVSWDPDSTITPIYNWQGGASAEDTLQVNSDGWYFLEVYLNGCREEDSVYVKRVYPELSYDSTKFKENINNDGSMGNNLNVSLTDEVFDVIGTMTENTHYTASNVPSGLSVHIESISPTQAIVSLTGNALAHSNAADIADLEITFLDAAFGFGQASAVTGYSQTGITVDFDDITDLALTQPGTDLWVKPSDINGGVTTIPVTVENTGESTLPAGTSFNFKFEYPLGTVALDETLGLSSDLVPGSTEELVTTGSVDFGSVLGLREFRGYITSMPDIVANNDTLDGWLVMLGADIIFENDIDDTIKTVNYPYTIKTSVVWDPDSAIIPVYEWWGGLSTADTLEINVDGEYGLEVLLNSCRFEDSVYVKRVFPVLSYDSTTFKENINNDGSIGNNLNIFLTDDVFDVIGTMTENTHFTTSNVPSGLSVSIESTSSTQAVVSLTGNALAHANAADISNLGITFLDAAFGFGQASAVTGYSQTGITVDFDDITDLALTQPGTDLWVKPSDINGGVTAIPITVENTGESTLPAGTSFNFKFEYPLGTVALDETLSLASDLAPGNTEELATTDSVDFGSALGLREFRGYITSIPDIVANNDTLDGWLVMLGANIEFEEGANDTIRVAGYPYTITVNVEWDPDSTIAPVYNWWEGSSASDTLEVDSDRWYGLEVILNGCRFEDSVYVRVKTNPEVTGWPTVGPHITYGQTLAEAQLSGGEANVAGSFEFDSETTILDAGTHNVAVSFIPDNSDYNNVGGTAEVIVDKASLTVTANDTARNVNEENPQFTIVYEGFVNNDNESDLDTLPVISCDANTDSPAGTYDINVSGGSDNNYDFSYTNGTLTVRNGSIIYDYSMSKLMVYPNPCKDIANLVCKDIDIEHIMVYNALGSLIKTIDNGFAQIEMEAYHPGVYYLRVMCQNGNPITVKVIKE